MAGLTVSTYASRAVAAGPSRIGHAQTWLTVAAVAALVTLFVSSQSGRGATATGVGLVQEDPGSDQATELIYFPGRPY
jgi:hypothetical protein